MTFQQPCPHCRIPAGVRRTPSGDLRCKLCTGPRLVLRDANLALSGAEIPLLTAARKSGRSSWLWAGVALLFTMMAAFFLLVVSGVLIFVDNASPAVTGLLLLFASLPLLGTYWSWRKSRDARRDAEGALEAARLSAAREVLQLSGRELTAEDLARYLDFSLPLTESLLARLNTDDSVTSRVTDEGDVTYHFASLRARIEEPGEVRTEGVELPLGRPQARSDEEEADEVHQRHVDDR